MPCCKRKSSKILGHEFECFDVQVKPASSYEKIEKLLNYTEPTFWIESDSSDGNELTFDSVRLQDFPENVSSVHICLNLDLIKKAQTMKKKFDGINIQLQLSSKTNQNKKPNTAPSL